MNDQLISSDDPVGSHTLQIIAKASRFNRWMYKEFRSFIKGEVLEIGSGIGNISDLVIKDGFNINLSDYNSEYCEWLKKKYSNLINVKSITQIDLLHPDFQTNYSKLQKKFDCIFLLNVIEHLSDDDAAVANCRFMMKQHGHLIILAPAYQRLYCTLDKELGHYRRYTLKNLKTILERQGFDIMKKSHLNFLGIWGWLLFGKIGHQKKLKSSELSIFDNVVWFAKVLDKIILKKFGLSVVVIGNKRNN